MNLVGLLVQTVDGQPQSAEIICQHVILQKVLFGPLEGSSPAVGRSCTCLVHRSFPQEAWNKKVSLRSLEINRIGKIENLLGFGLLGGHSRQESPVEIGRPKLR